MAHELPTLVGDDVSIFRRKSVLSLALDHKQTLSLLANAFLCTFDGAEEIGDAGCGGGYLNFSTLFECFEEPGDDDDDGGKRNRIVQQKLKCLMRYFMTVVDEESNRQVRIERAWVGIRGIRPDWEGLIERVRLVNVVESLEACQRGLEIVGTRGAVGGDVFGFTAQEEEINSLVHPELIVARLFVEPLGDDEVLLVSGVRRFSQVQGEGETFKYTGPSRDLTARDFAFVQRRNSENRNDFQREYLIAELDNLFAVLSKARGTKMVTVGGSRSSGDLRDQRVQYLITAMAASRANVPVTFCTYGDDCLREELICIQDVLRISRPSVKDLLRGLCEYGRLERGRGLYFFLKHRFP